MKSLLLFLGVFGASATCLSAQSRISIAPTYWFNENIYSFQADITFNGSTNPINVSEHNQTSSFGLSTHYQFAPKWDISAGVLYYRGKINLIELSGPNGVRMPFTSEGWQIPVLMNYHLTKGRLSPYLSVGALFNKSTKVTSTPVRTNGIIGIGLDYRFSSALSLSLQPTVSYPFKRPSSDAVIQYTNYNSYTLGVQTQLNWHF